jgi:hypothetical protein
MVTPMVFAVALGLVGCSDEAASFKFSEVSEGTFPGVELGTETLAQLNGTTTAGSGTMTLPSGWTTLPTTLPTTVTTQTLIGTETLDELGLEGVDPSEVSLDDVLKLDLDPSQIEALGVAPEDISRVLVRDLQIEVLSPEGGDLSFLDTLELWVSADGFEDSQLVAFAGFEEGLSVVNLPVVPTDLKGYMFGENLVLTPVVDGLPPSVDTKVRVTLEVEVGVTWDGLVGRF